MAASNAWPAGFVKRVSRRLARAADRSAGDAPSTHHLGTAWFREQQVHAVATVRDSRAKPGAGWISARWQGSIHSKRQRSCANKAVCRAAFDRVNSLRTGAQDGQDGSNGIVGRLTANTARD